MVVGVEVGVVVGACVWVAVAVEVGRAVGDMVRVTPGVSVGLAVDVGALVRVGGMRVGVGTGRAHATTRAKATSAQDRNAKRLLTVLGRRCAPPQNDAAFPVPCFEADMPSQRQITVLMSDSENGRTGEPSH